MPPKTLLFLTTGYTLNPSIFSIRVEILQLNAPDSMKFVYNLVISGAKGGIFADLKRPSVPAAH